MVDVTASSSEQRPRRRHRQTLAVRELEQRDSGALGAPGGGYSRVARDWLQVMQRSDQRA